MSRLTDHKTVAQQLSASFLARQNCAKLQNHEWFERHDEVIESIMRDAPSGSGIDNGVKIADELCGASKLVFDVEFHHMDENGSYDGWSTHIVTVTPEFDGVLIEFKGEDRDNIQDYLGEVMYHWLQSPVIQPRYTTSVRKETT